MRGLHGRILLPARQRHPAAEFNWWAAQIVLRYPFREQVIFGLDDMLSNIFIGTVFPKNDKFVHYAWDVLVSAYIIDPTLVTESEVRHVVLNTQFGPSYGQSLAFGGQATAGTQKATIVTNVDSRRFWEMLNDTMYYRFVPNSKHGAGAKQK